MEPDLENQIENVREARANHVRLYGIISDLEKEIQDKYATTYEALGQATLAVKIAENRLRDLTLAAYAATGNKKPAPGVGIRIVKEISCDESQAVAWAVEARALNCLSLQKSNFKKVAEGLALPFVEINEVATATISKEL
jgi:hypothetical protein